MQGYILNVELISNNKFKKEELEGIKELLESREEYIAFYILFSEAIQINFSNHIEIYLEDRLIENDIQQDIEKMLEDLDLIIPGGLVNDSKIEWSSTSSISPINIIYYKDNNEWIEKISESEMDFFNAEWIDEDEIDPYEGRMSNDFDDDPDW
jgi:hypothetical protein